MRRTDLANGISVFYHSADTQGRVTFQYPDGSQVRTTWHQLSEIQSLIGQLRQAYEILLVRAETQHDVPVDTLMRMDELLFSLRALKPSKHGDSGVESAN